MNLNDFFTQKQNTFSIGQRLFWLSDGVTQNAEFILAQVDMHMVSAIDLANGNRWTEPFEVKNPKEILLSEMYVIIGNRPNWYSDSNHTKKVVVYGKRNYLMHGDKVLHTSGRTYRFVSHNDGNKTSVMDEKVHTICTKQIYIPNGQILREHVEAFGIHPLTEWEVILRDEN